jgi:flagellar biosynthesis protein FlhF
MNNPYATKPAVRKTAASRSAEILFAPEVYRDEPTRRDNAEEAAKAEIARLRTELRGETRALRAAVNRPRKAEENHDMTAQLASLRSAVAELVASQAQQKDSDAVSSAIAACGVEGPAAVALARIANAKKNGRSDAVRAAIASMIDTMPAPWELAQEGPVLIGLVGPAGVGKTTTAAKLAARAIMAKKTVALISCDAFRVGAIDQLGKYADLMEARFHTAMNQEELLDIIANEDADVIIVDTVGRPVDANATEALLGADDVRATRGRRVEVFLCVPASIRAGDMSRVACDYALVQPTGIIITKLDETSMPAGIIHASFATKLPLSSICNGQRVPEDIMPATTRALVDALLPNQGNESQ